MFYVRAQVVRQKKRYGAALTIDNRAWISTCVARISPHRFNGRPRQSSILAASEQNVYIAAISLTVSSTFAKSQQATGLRQYDGGDAKGVVGFVATREKISLYKHVSAFVLNSFSGEK
tara:strand:+ start:1340 stop:1693 length:354 start_codon:yes stop_codon:yes gene_type:complete